MRNNQYTSPYSIHFKRDVAEKFLQGASKNSLSKKYNIARALVTLWTQKYQSGEFDDVSETVSELLSTITEWERLAGRQAKTIDKLRGKLAAHGIPE